MNISEHSRAQEQEEASPEIGAIGITYKALEAWVKEEPKRCIAAMKHLSPSHVVGPARDAESRKGDVSRQAFNALNSMRHTLELMVQIYESAIISLTRTSVADHSSEAVTIACREMQQQITNILRGAPGNQNSADRLKPLQICSLTSTAARLVLDTWQKPEFQQACRQVMPDAEACIKCHRSTPITFMQSLFRKYIHG